MTVVARQNISRRGEVRRFPIARKKALRFRSISITPFRSKKSSRRGVAERQCAVALRVSRRRTNARFCSSARIRSAENVAQFEKANARRARADVAREDIQQTRNKARPQRDVIFAQRIAQLERAFARSSAGSARDQRRGARFRQVRERPVVAAAQTRNRSVRSAARFRSEPAPIADRERARSQRRARLPRSSPLRAEDRNGNSECCQEVSPSLIARFLQAESFENLIDAFLWNRQRRSVGCIARSASETSGGGGGSSPAVAISVSGFPPASSRISSVARCDAGRIIAGSTPRSKR